ncbi:hypothetical protein LEMLEM_LOCUS1073 [Lemmus lemmus]
MEKCWHCLALNMENVLDENLASQETSFSSHAQMITVPQQSKSALAGETLSIGYTSLRANQTRAAYDASFTSCAIRHSQYRPDRLENTRFPSEPA